MIQTTQIHTTLFFNDAVKTVAITEERKALLKKISEKIAAEYQKNNVVNINFICTHNSRRSQLGQVWAFFATAYFKLENIFSFSGGTEVTAFFRNTVKTLRDVGFNFNVIDFLHQNPKYLISFKGTKKAVLGFSKLYDNVENRKPFIAITTCNNADKNCPFISEAIARFHLPFVDPKHSDGTDTQKETYLKTNRQIAAEMFVIFKEAKRLLS